MASNLAFFSQGLIPESLVRNNSQRGTTFSDMESISERLFPFIHNLLKVVSFLENKKQNNITALQICIRTYRLSNNGRGYGTPTVWYELSCCVSLCSWVMFFLSI